MEEFLLIFTIVAYVVVLALAVCFVANTVKGEDMEQDDSIEKKETVKCKQRS